MKAALPAFVVLTPTDEQIWQRTKLFDLLTALVFDADYIPKATAERQWRFAKSSQHRALCKAIDDLHRAGAPWPYILRAVTNFSRGVFPFRPLVRIERKPTPRPDHLPYCVEWTGGFWAPCGTIKDRRAAGYLQLLMCWAPPLPKAGDFILSSDRARFAYRIAEVERFPSPRGAKRWTCRLWATRHDPLHLPKNANVLSFYWHPRSRKDGR